MPDMCFPQYLMTKTAMQLGRDGGLGGRPEVRLIFNKKLSLQNLLFEENNWTMCSSKNCPRWSRISVSSAWSLSQATTNWSSTSGQFKLCQPSKIGNSPQILVLFLIPFCQQFAGFTRGRSRTSAHTASAGSNSCHMSSSTQGFIQVANQIQQLCDPLYLLCPMPYTWEGPVCQVAISLNLKNKVLNGHRKMQINLRTPW